MSITKSDALLAMISGAVFWLPSTILHMLRGSDFAFVHWTLLLYIQTFATLATLLAVWFLYRTARTDRKAKSVRRIALCMLLGIWVLGPFFLSVNATFSGGGFARKGGWLGVILATLFFPVMTPLLSVYDGSILNLSIDTLLLALATFRFSAKVSKKVE